MANLVGIEALDRTLVLLTILFGFTCLDLNGALRWANAIAIMLDLTTNKRLSILVVVSTALLVWKARRATPRSKALPLLLCRAEKTVESLSNVCGCEKPSGMVGLMSDSRPTLDVRKRWHVRLNSRPCIVCPRLTEVINLSTLHLTLSSAVAPSVISGVG